MGGMEHAKPNKVVIMQGVSGSGKSSWAKKHYPDALVCSADHYFEVEGEYRYDRNDVPEAHRHCLRKFVEALTRNEPLVVVDNVNITKVDMAPYVALAEALGYDIEIVRVHASVETCARRGRHGVPLEVCQAQAQHMEKPLRRWRAKIRKV